MDIKVVEYTTENKKDWNQFVSKSKNGTFLFNRDYMEYHADRFEDMSLMFYNRNKLIGLLPANKKGNILFSHSGLTYGGVVSGPKMKASLMLNIFSYLKEHLQKQGIKKLVYKVVPYIYHTLPAEEDLYALFRNGAVLVRRDISSTILLDSKLSFNSGRRWRIKKAKKKGLKVDAGSNDFAPFMRVVEDLLRSKYEVKPTHSAEEIDLLASRFPDNIKLFTIKNDDSILAGVIVYEIKTVVHTQYVASTKQGKEMSALDFLLDYLINSHYKDKQFFDFGVSTEDGGKHLNPGLINQKEELGGRAVVYDTYELSI